MEKKEAFLYTYISNFIIFEIYCAKKDGYVSLYIKILCESLLDSINFREAY